MIMIKSQHKAIYKRLLIGFFLMLAVKVLYGQYGNWGFSCGTKYGRYIGLKGSKGFAAGFENNSLQGRRIVSVSYYQALEFNLFSSRPTEKLELIHVTGGQRWGSNVVHAHIQAGIGLVRGVTRGKLKKVQPFLLKPDIYNPKHFLTIGLPLKMGFSLTPVRFLRIGLDIEMNLNPATPLIMPFMLSIAIGQTNPGRL